MYVTWEKNGDNWHSFAEDTVIQRGRLVSGVYIIWQTQGRVVKVGQGIIAQRLAEHRRDPMILFHTRGRNVGVTWTALGSHDLDGVEAFLGANLDPLVAERFPDATPIPVNFPW